MHCVCECECVVHRTTTQTHIYIHKYWCKEWYDGRYKWARVCVKSILDTPLHCIFRRLMLLHDNTIFCTNKCIGIVKLFSIYDVACFQNFYFQILNFSLIRTRCCSSFCVAIYTRTSSCLFKLNVLFFFLNGPYNFTKYT